MLFNFHPYYLLQEYQREVTSTFGKQLSVKALENILIPGASAQQLLASQLEKSVPVLGTIIAGGISFVACFFLLTCALKDLSKDGERVMQKALLVAASKQKC